MEYFAKSRAFLLKEKEKEKLIKKITEIASVFDAASDTYICGLLQKFIKMLQAGQILEEQKTLQDHLNETVRCGQHFFEIYGDYFSDTQKQLILFACKIHDIGKANAVFQSMVNPSLCREKTSQIPHGFLSAMLLSEKRFLKEYPKCDKDDFSVLLTAVFYHHTRPDTYDAADITDYCERYFLNHVREFLNDHEAAIDIFNLNRRLFTLQKGERYLAIEEDIWCRYMLVKGMLNKFDWAVSAGNTESERNPDLIEKKLCANILAALKGQLRPAQEYMVQNRDRNVIMIAPTGSGKTEAALLWINGEKGFYTLPLKVSSDAIYKRIEEKYAYESAALLHSDSLNSYLKTAADLEDGYKNYEQAKLFSFPLTVCTVDQLFRFVYKAPGTEIFAATLKYSKIVIDEIQSYSPRVVAALIYGLAEIRRMGGKFAIITATFPPVLQHFMKKNGLLEDRDYVCHDFSDAASAVRHRIKILEGEFDILDIQLAAEHKKVLVICNTVSKAQAVYTMLKQEGAHPGLLHSHFIREHRSILEKNILDFSTSANVTGVWVTTQIVEASLDIDFDLLYTEMCTADSLLQRMGRCNRAGKKGSDQVNVFISCNLSGRGGVYDKDIYDRSTKLLKKWDEKSFSETDKAAYIHEVYDIRQIRKTAYFCQIEKYIRHFQNVNPADYSKKDAENEFRAIRSITVLPDDIYKQNLPLIDGIKELMKMPHTGIGIRKAFRDKLAGMTMNLNIQFGIPNGIDKQTLEPFDIHLTRLCYEFDGTCGMGLVLDKAKDEDNFV